MPLKTTQHPVSLQKESEKYNELVSKISEIDVQLREAKKSKTTMEEREMEDNKKLEVQFFGWNLNYSC